VALLTLDCVLVQKLAIITVGETKSEFGVEVRADITIVSAYRMNVGTYSACAEVATDTARGTTQTRGVGFDSSIDTY